MLRELPVIVIIEGHLRCRAAVLSFLARVDRRPVRLAEPLLEHRDELRPGEAALRPPLRHVHAGTALLLLGQLLRLVEVDLPLVLRGLLAQLKRQRLRLLHLHRSKEGDTYQPGARRVTLRLGTRQQPADVAVARVPQRCLRLPPDLSHRCAAPVPSAAEGLDDVVELLDDLLVAVPVDEVDDPPPEVLDLQARVLRHRVAVNNDYYAPGRHLGLLSQAL